MEVATGRDPERSLGYVKETSPPVSPASPEPSRAGAPKIAFERVAKTYGRGPSAVVALDPVDLSISPGEFVSIVGPSGCGKTTLLNIAAGFERPTSGRVLEDGMPVSGPGPSRGVVFQQGALFNWMTVRENAAFGPRSRGTPAATAYASADALLELVGLSAFAHKYPYQLSGGMQQRVGIARALANDPSVLLMDEPFAALDQQNREMLQEEIRSIWQRTGKTVLWITHSIEEALFLSTRVVVMTARPGRIKTILPVDFSSRNDPLISTTAEFAAKRREVTDLLKTETRRAQLEEVAG